MIEYAQAKIFIETVPWPEGTRPLLTLRHGFVPALGMPGWMVQLYRPEDRFPDVVQISGPTPEGALRYALDQWVANLSLPPALREDFARLTN